MRCGRYVYEILPNLGKRRAPRGVRVSSSLGVTPSLLASTIARAELAAAGAVEVRRLGGCDEQEVDVPTYQQEDADYRHPMVPPTITRGGSHRVVGSDDYRRTRFTDRLSADRLAARAGGGRVPVPAPSASEPILQGFDSDAEIYRPFHFCCPAEKAKRPRYFSSSHHR